MNEAWHTTGNGEAGLASIKEKIRSCGVDLMAWGLAKTDPNVDPIKKNQQQLDALTEVETTDETRAEYLEVSERMDDLLLK